MDQLITEENEEDNDYVVEKLDTDEEDMMTNQEIKNDTEELIGDGEEVEKEIDNDLCAQLQSDDEDFKPVIKKIKLVHEICN
jgi:bifunctional DNA-binding transcriptional regulator/antitoxin component of YhaV-PrlF toxin-antitoxin module